VNPIRRRRLWIVSLVVVAVCGATALALAALNQNLQHFYSPSDVKAGMAPAQRNFRLGGLVEEGSVARAGDSLKVRFLVTDRFEKTPVEFEGILPDLFKEGQSVVATGTLRGDGTFAAHEVLAKHDENYMPKEVADAIARAKQQAAASPQGSGGTP
jgi:cytochrome c-type biogenesis protein CcmE